MKELEQGRSITERLAELHAKQDPSILDDLEIGQAVQSTSDITYMVAQAVLRPRDEVKAFNRARKDAEILAERAYYRFPMGGKPVEGPSVKLARCMQMAWGNNVAKARKLEERTLVRGDFKAIVARYEGVFIDLETGANSSMEYEGALRPPSKGFAKSEEEAFRWYAMQCGVIQSKAQRNAITNGLPAWFVDGCMEAARRSAANEVLKGTTIEKAIDGCIEAFASRGKKVPDLERILGRPITAWSSADIIQMREIWHAVKSGETTIEDVFAEFSMDEAPKPAAAKSKDTQRANLVQRATEGAPNPLAKLEIELAEATTDAAVTKIQKAWMKDADESIKGDITALCTARLKALSP